MHTNLTALAVALIDFVWACREEIETVNLIMDSFHQIIGAIYQSQYTGIREFRAEASPPGLTPRWLYPRRSMELTTAGFDMPTDNHLHAGKFFFSHLRRVELNLDFAFSGDDPKADTLRQLSNLAILLAEAKDLMDLSLHLSVLKYYPLQVLELFTRDGRLRIPNLSLGVTWPNLRFLSFGGILAAGEELLDLVDHHKGTLEKINFEYCRLTSGSWAHIIDHVVSGTTIAAFELHKVKELIYDWDLFSDEDSMYMDEPGSEAYGGALTVRNGCRYFVSPRPT